MIESLIRGGNPDLAGLCLALVDWSAELRLLKQDVGKGAEKPAAAGTGRAEQSRSRCYLDKL